MFDALFGFVKKATNSTLDFVKENVITETNLKIAAAVGTTALVCKNGKWIAEKACGVRDEIADIFAYEEEEDEKPKKKSKKKAKSKKKPTKAKAKTVVEPKLVTSKRKPKKRKK